MCVTFDALSSMQPLQPRAARRKWVEDAGLSNPDWSLETPVEGYLADGGEEGGRTMGRLLDKANRGARGRRKLPCAGRLQPIGTP